ncbi:MAG TPA: hypothetical protein VEI97_14485 [bacterium]|nr:hypothetical protein [bacterium]
MVHRIGLSEAMQLELIRLVEVGYRHQPRYGVLRLTQAALQKRGLAVWEDGVWRPTDVGHAVAARMPDPRVPRWSGAGRTPKIDPFEG